MEGANSDPANDGNREDGNVFPIFLLPEFGGRLSENPLPGSRRTLPGALSAESR